MRVPTAGNDAAAGVVSVTARRAGMVPAVPVAMAPVRAVSAVLAPVDRVARAAMAVVPAPALRAAKVAA